MEEGECSAEAETGRGMRGPDVSSSAGMVREEGSPEARDMCEDGGGYGRRVKSSEPRASYAGSKRGRPAKEGGGKQRVRQCTPKQLKWTAESREEYARITSGGGERYGKRFERGEGGGVT